MKETNKIIDIDLGAANSVVAAMGDDEKNVRRSVETTGGQNKHSTTKDYIMETKESKANGEKIILEGTEKLLNTWKSTISLSKSGRKRIYPGD